jgi:hypothetical protein
MLRRLRFPLAAFAALLLAALWSKPALAVTCNDMYCTLFKDCAFQTNGPSTWCMSGTGWCMWSGDCNPIGGGDPSDPGG